MREENGKTGYNGEGVRGWGWALFGVLTAAAAKYTLGDGGGLFGGCNRNVATYRDLDYERQLTVANAEIGQLKAEKYADAATLAAERRYEDKFDAIEKQINELSSAQAVFNANTMSAIGIVGEQAKRLAAMTTTIISAPSILASEAVAKSLPTPAASGSGTGQ